MILDVVYNHTAEGNHLGPMLSFKGIDNATYYRLIPEDPRYYMDFTGHRQHAEPGPPSVLRLIMDSLRYFVHRVPRRRLPLRSGVDAGPEFYDVDRLSAFFESIHQDPVLSRVKLIAEPWDVGPGGYQVGNFPILWTEWNGVYRDTIRDFWRDGPRGRVRQRFTDPPACTGQMAAHPSPRSTSSPPMTGSRCATSSPTTRSTTRPT